MLELSTSIKRHVINHKTFRACLLAIKGESDKNVYLFSQPVKELRGMSINSYVVVYKPVM